MIKKKRRENFAVKKQREREGKNLQRKEAEAAPLYCKQKTHYWRQGKTIIGEKLIDLN
jgi:hypothetical protein